MERFSRGILYTTLLSLVVPAGYVPIAAKSGVMEVVTTTMHYLSACALNGNGNKEIRLSAYRRALGRWGAAFAPLSLGRVLAPCALRLPADGYGRLMGFPMLLAAPCAGPWGLVGLGVA